MNRVEPYIIKLPLRIFNVYEDDIRNLTRQYAFIVEEDNKGLLYEKLKEFTNSKSPNDVESIEFLTIGQFVKYVNGLSEHKATPADFVFIRGEYNRCYFKYC